VTVTVTLTVTFVSFVTVFTVYFSFVYSRCDLSTGIFYTNIWIWMYKPMKFIQKQRFYAMMFFSTKCQLLNKFMLSLQRTNHSQPAVV